MATTKEPEPPAVMVPTAERLLASPRGVVVHPDAYRGLREGLRHGRGHILASVSDSGLRGRGGAGFPAARKWEAVVERPGPRYAVANGEEGEPASWKDRYLLRHHPHLVLEGLALAALAVDADEAWVYVGDEVAAATVEAALAEAAEVLADVPPIHVARVPHTYVAGEESAAVRYLSGGPALPTAKPPRPFEEGVRGRPTLVSNVETLAHAAWILAHGPEVFREVGTAASPGTFLACITGAVARSELIEAPLGVSLRDLVEMAAPTGPVGFLLLGGYFSGVLTEDLLHLPADYDELRANGVGLGNGTIIVVGANACPVRVMGDLLAFFAAESAGQCLACAKGTAAMRDTLAGFRDGTASPEDVARLAHYGTSLMGRGACQLLDAAASTGTRVVERFGALLDAHLAAPCRECRRAGPPDPTGGFAVDVDSATGRSRS